MHSGGSRTGLGVGLLVATALAGAGCREPMEPNGSRSIDQLRAVPTSTQVGGRDLVLRTELWRDFMPIAPPDGRPLVALIRVTAADGGALPAGLGIDSFWVIHGRELWQARPEPGAGSDDRTLEVVARDGPKWGPGVNVDVVVRIVDAAGKSHLMRAPEQPVGRTD